MESTNDENEYLTCRVCLEYSSKYINFHGLFKNESERNEDLTYLECFELVTNININFKLNPRQCLCIKCGEDLKNAFTFLRKAQLAEKYMCESIEDLNEDNFCDNYEQTISNDGSSPASDVSKNVILDSVSEDMENEVITEWDDAKTEKSEAELLKKNVNKKITFQNQLNTATQIVSCDKCGYNCETSLLEEHKRNEHDMQSEFNCHLCSKDYKSSHLLNAHLGYHRRKRKNRSSDACAICGKNFSTSYYLRQHTDLVHSNERQKFECDQCDKVYVSKNSLECHKRMHSNQTLKCSQCFKSFSKQYELNVHMRFHTKNYPFDCTICGKKFAIKCHLRTHMWQHQGLKLQCEDCGKLFSSTKALQEHSYVHSTVMPFPCVYCHKSYPSKQKYKVHLRNVHSIEFDAKEHVRLSHTQKRISRRKNIILVQTDVVNEMEVATKENDVVEKIS